MPMTPHAMRAPAWPVVLESGNPPRPRSSSSACTICTNTYGTHCSMRTQNSTVARHEGRARLQPTAPRRQASASTHQRAADDAVRPPQGDDAVSESDGHLAVVTRHQVPKVAHVPLRVAGAACTRRCRCRGAMKRAVQRSAALSIRCQCRTHAPCVLPCGLKWPPALVQPCVRSPSAWTWLQRGNWSGRGCACVIVVAVQRQQLQTTQCRRTSRACQAAATSEHAQAHSSRRIRLSHRTIARCAGRWSSRTSRAHLQPRQRDLDLHGRCRAISNGLLENDLATHARIGSVGHRAHDRDGRLRLACRRRAVCRQPRVRRSGGRDGHHRSRADKAGSECHGVCASA